MVTITDDTPTIAGDQVCVYIVGVCGVCSGCCVCVLCVCGVLGWY